MAVMDISKDPSSDQAATPAIPDEEVKQVDRAALFLAEAETVAPLSAKAEKRLKLKIDLIMVPMVSSSIADLIQVLLTSYIAFLDCHTWSSRQSRPFHCCNLWTRRG